MRGMFYLMDIFQFFFYLRDVLEGPFPRKKEDIPFLGGGKINKFLDMRGLQFHLISISVIDKHILSKTSRQAKCLEGVCVVFVKISNEYFFKIIRQYKRLLTFLFVMVYT